MKKLIVCLLAATLTLSLAAPTAQAAPEGRGGLMGFVAGCCFGIRAGGDYNEGKDLHWREWVRIVPIVGIVFAVWDGIEGAEGVTTSELADRYGSTFY